MDPEAEKAQLEEKAKKHAADKAHVDALALEFASKIPAHEFSPAELQGHLMRYKRRPQAAIDKAEEFIEQTRKDRKEKEIKDAEEKRKAEEERKKEEEDEAKEAEDKKKEEKKKEAKAAEKKKRGEAKSTKSSSSAHDSGSGSRSSSEEDKSDSASESESGKQKKSKWRHGTSKKTKTDTECSSGSSATLLEDTPKDAKVVTQGHVTKDSGYGTPSSVDA